MMIKLNIGIFLSIFSIVQGVELPANFKVCNRNDPNLTECLNDASEKAVRFLAPGSKFFRSFRIEPLALDRVTIGESTGPIALKQDYQNIELHGLTKGLRISNLTFDREKLIFDSNTFNPQIDFVADYTLSGNILLLPINGHGRCNISFVNMKARHIVYGTETEKDGVIYLRVKKYEVELRPERVLMNFDNLFDGDAILGPSMNQFLNENAELLFQELRAPYQKTFCTVFAKIADDVFSRVPFNVILPDS